MSYCHFLLMPFSLQIDGLWCLTEVIATIVMISYATPEFLIVIVPILIVFVGIQRFYIVASRQLKRLYSVSKSPLFSHFSETVSGAPIVRAFGQTIRFAKESESRMQTNVDCYYLSAISNRWLSIRIENLSNIMIFFTAFFGVYKRDTLTSGLAGLAITYAINVTSNFLTQNWTISNS